MYELTKKIINVLVNGNSHTKDWPQYLEQALEFTKTLTDFDEKLVKTQEDAQRKEMLNHRPVTHYVRFPKTRKWLTAYKDGDTYYVHDEDGWYDAEEVE